MRDHPDKSEIIDVANALADAARHAALSYFRTKGLAADNKDVDGGFDPVTAADRAAEAAMRKILAARRPSDAIFGEEFGGQSGTSGLKWVLDPIDGTRAYLCGSPTWGVLISVEDAGGPIFGIIDQPHIGERFTGGLGRADLVHEERSGELACRPCRSLSDAILLTTFPEIGTPAERRAFEAVRDEVKLTRYGLDCYGYALVALGQVDLVIEAGLSAYDISAPIAVIEAAGGRVTNWQGGPVHSGGQVLAAGDPVLHQKALDILNGAHGT